MPEAAAIGNRVVRADEVIERRDGSALCTRLASGDSVAETCRSSSAICGVNHDCATGVDERERGIG